MIHYCQLSSNSTSHPYLIMSRRSEIKQKQELQARFQLAMSANNQKALNWLKPLKSTASTTSTSSETPNANNPTSDDSFMDLQIIPQGASLSKLDNLQKIGDFINSKDITKMKQSTTTTASNLTSNRVTKSKPMLALMNKMRDSNRKNVRQNQHHHQQQQQSTSSINGKSNKPMIPNKSQSIVKNYNNEEEDDDDDEEDDEDSRAIRSRTVKKGSSLLLENKLNNKNSGTKKKNVRPF